MKLRGDNEASDRSIPAGIVVLALTPSLMVMLPWDFGNDVSPWRLILRYNSLVVPFVEFVFVGVAITKGFMPARALGMLSPLTKAGLVILTFCTLWTTLFVAVVPFTAIMGITKFVAHCLFALGMLHMLRNWSEAQRNLVWPAIGFGLVGYCVLWSINIAFYNPIGIDWVNLVPGATNVRWVGFFAFACFCAAIGTFTVPPHRLMERWHLPTALVFATVGFTIAFWTGTRGALAAIALAALISSIVLPSCRQIIVVTSISMVCGLAIASVLPVVHPIYGLERIAASSNPSSGLDAVSSNRFQTWMEIFGKFMQRPVLGWGIDQLRYTYVDQANLVRNPHQAILQVLVSTGLFGLVAYLCIAARFIQSIPRKFSESYQFAGVAYLAGGTGYGLYDGFFYFTYPVMMFIIAAACVATQPHSFASGKSG